MGDHTAVEPVRAIEALRENHMKTLVGGEIKGYTKMLNEARQIAVKRMVDEAKLLNADAVIGVRFSSSQIMTGAAEVVAYGTAVKIIK